MRRNGWCREPFFQPEAWGVERHPDGETADRKRVRHFHEPRQQFASLPHVMAPPQRTVEQAAQLHWQSLRRRTPCAAMAGAESRFSSQWRGA